MNTTVWWKKSQTTNWYGKCEPLFFCKVLQPSQVVVWDFFHQTVCWILGIKGWLWLLGFCLDFRGVDWMKKTEMGKLEKKSLRSLTWEVHVQRWKDALQAAMIELPKWIQMIHQIHFLGEWFQISFIFTLNPGEMIQFEEHIYIFQMVVQTPK